MNGQQMIKQQQPHFSQHIQHQHRMVTKGPNLSFPEFDGANSNGSIRKPEFFSN
jgi:hypothetical protein